ncbi:unnamed protein product [Brassica oleracea]
MSNKFSHPVPHRVSRRPGYSGLVPRGLRSSKCRPKPVPQNI